MKTMWNFTDLRQKNYNDFFLEMMLMTWSFFYDFDTRSLLIFFYLRTAMQKQIALFRNLGVIAHTQEITKTEP